MEELLEILEDMYPDVDFATEDELVSGKIFNSFDIISIIAEVNDVFDVSIPAEEITTENFDSAEALYRLIQRLQDEE